MQQNISRWERQLSVGAGAALIVLAARRQHQQRMSLFATGAGLLARGFSGYCPVSAAIGRSSTDTRHALGGSRGIHVRESVTIARPPSDVYRVWRDLAGLPRIMRHIDRIDWLENGRTHWVASGPAGTRVEWDADIINDIPNELIAWRSVEGSTLVNAGSVRFMPVAKGTRVDVHLQYAPPGGHAGDSVARLLGTDLARDVREDLQRFKKALETGRDTSLSPFSEPWPVLS